jgi:hypothetical protein
MAEAVELGWRHEGPWAEAVDGDMIRAGGEAPAVIVADLAPAPGGTTWAEHARLAIRSLAVGYGMAATADGTRLEDVLGRLADPPVGAIDDELTRLGVVLILGRDSQGRRRVLAAHYLRPVARDIHGHIQRLPPAVLATWNEVAACFDHFAWGVAGELAGRTGRRSAAFERELATRARGLASAMSGARTSAIAGGMTGDTPASIPPAPSKG